MNLLRKLAILGLCSVFALPALAGKVHPVTGEALAEDQRFVYRVKVQPVSIDPQLNLDVTGTEIVRDLFEGLYNQDENGKLVPGVALRHELSADRTVYTFHLRDNAKWSDGRAVTAHDFVYAWRRLADPETASPYQWFITAMNLKNATEITKGTAPVDSLGVEAIDDVTLKVTLNSAMSYFPGMTTHTSTFPTPRWVIEEHGIEWTKPENIVGNGAYTLTEHVLNEYSVRERNPDYWDDANTIINQVQLLVISDDSIALTRYYAGEIDRTHVPAGRFPTIKLSHPDEVATVPRLCSFYFMFNVSEGALPALKDPRVRLALSYAIDRDVITGKILSDGSPSAYNLTPEQTAGYTIPELEFAKWDQETRNHKALELLEAAGFNADNRLRLRLLYNTSESHKKVAIAIRKMWSDALGVHTILENQDWKTYQNTRRQQNFDVVRSAWCGDYNEASTFLDLVHTKAGYNHAKYSNPAVDKLLDDARKMDNPLPNYHEVEQIIAAEAPVAPVFHYVEAYMFQTDVLGSWPVNNVEQVWYSRNLYRVK